MRIRRARIAALALAFVVVACTPLPDGATPVTPQHVQAFGAAPGTLLAAQPVASPDPALRRLGAQLTRVRYASRSGIGGAPVEVSGVVIEPAGAPPPGGWPVISFGHATTGLADACAPSRSPDLLGQLRVVLPLVARGYLVAATDYEGLGTPGPHPYLQPLSAGRSVIDAVRAARELVPAASTRWIAVGHSQGGQAAWAAAELAGRWGRGMEFLGSVALVPAADISPLVRELPGDLSGVQQELYPAVLYSLRLRHPELDYADYLSGDALTAVDALELRCATGAAFAPVKDFVPRSPAALMRARQWLAELALPQRPAAGPLLVVAGAADDVVPIATVDAAVAAACELGDAVDYRRYPGAGHVLPPAAEADALHWIADRLAGLPAPSSCSS